MDLPLVNACQAPGKPPRLAAQRIFRSSQPLPQLIAVRAATVMRDAIDRPVDFTERIETQIALGAGERATTDHFLTISQRDYCAITCAEVELSSRFLSLRWYK